MVPIEGREAFEVETETKLLQFSFLFSEDDV